MKELKILALITMLALAFTLSAPAQSQDTTSSDQYTTQSTDQTSSTPATVDGPSMSMQQNESTESSISSPEVDDSRKFATTRSDQDKREPRQEIEYLQQLQNDSGAN
jgi:hypothetical protein